VRAADIGCSTRTPPRALSEWSLLDGMSEAAGEGLASLYILRRRRNREDIMEISLGIEIFN
jgi:hypothetical protein